MAEVSRGAKVVARKKSKSDVVSVEVRVPIFGPPPVVSDHERADYDELYAQMAAHVQPADPIEAAYTRDIVDLTFELFRYRNCKARILESAIPRALEDKLTPFMPGRHRFGSMEKYGLDGAREPTPVMELVNEWMRGDKEAIKRVAEMLELAKLTMEDIRAHAFFLELGSIERVDRLIAMLEARRNGALREIERYRVLLAHALKTVTQRVEEAQFEVVGSRTSEREAIEH